MNVNYVRGFWHAPITTALLGALCVGPSSLAAQAICSAPHSSPTLAGGGSIGTLPTGTGWFMLSGLQQQSRRTFNADGTRQPLLAGGAFRSRSLYLSAGLGIARGVDVWAQMPVHRMHYEDTGGARDRAGVGDVRVAMRVSPEGIGLRLPFAVRVGSKIPGTAFPLDATVIPLTEGQTDFETSVETGGLFRGSVYMLGWVGYRWRTENRGAARKPGNEGFLHIATGTAIGGARIEIAADLLQGAAPRQLGFAVEASRRRLLQLSPTVTRKAGVGDLEFTTVIPIVGRNLPTGLGVSVGYRLGWGAHEREPAAPQR